jgi:hypothetical protein
LIVQTLNTPIENLQKFILAFELCLNCLELAHFALRNMLSASTSTLSLPAYEFQRSLNEYGSDTVSSKHDHFSKILYTGHDFERQIYIVRVSNLTIRQRRLSFCKLSLDGIDTNDDEQDQLFTMYSIDTVHCSYMAAQSRVRQYTQFVALLERIERAWADKVQEAGHAIASKNLSRVSLKDSKVEDDEQDILLAHTLETVFANLTAAQYRVRQYTHFLKILQREEDAWAKSFQKASCMMPSYEPARGDYPRRGDLMKSNMLRV